MKTWGIACHIDKDQPVVIAIEATGPRAALQGREVFRHRGNPNEAWAEKLRFLTADLEAAIDRERPDAVVVRSMDWTRMRRENLTRARYQLEGAVLAAAARHVAQVEALSGDAIGRRLAATKAAIEAEAARAFGGDAAAGAAAIAGLETLGAL